MNHKQKQIFVLGDAGDLKIRAIIIHKEIWTLKRIYSNYKIFAFGNKWRKKNVLNVITMCVSSLYGQEENT